MLILITRNRKDIKMTKSMFHNIVRQGFFSIKWLKNNGELGHIKRGIIGKNGYRFTKGGEVREHPNYLLVFCVSTNGNHSWANVNPDTILEINNVSYQ
tara:strand:- start:757 stop:1050 length:294 start_codon:yes stop_codon:yes gene_type:complete